MRVLMISTDRKILEEGSAVRARMIEYGTVCDELHIVIPTYNLQPATYNQKMQISQNVFAYPAVAPNKIFALWKAFRVGVSISPTTYNLQPTTWLVTSQDPFETGFIAWLIARKIRAKLELQIHTDFLNPYFRRESFINKIRVSIARFILPKADGIRVVSQRINDSLQPTIYNLKAITVVLPIFVDIEKIKNASPSVDLRKKYPQFDFVVLMASRLTKEKNISLAVEVMKGVVKEHPKAGLVIVGSGPEEAKLKLLTTTYNLQPNIIFESWSDDVISYMKTADCFLLTSNYEGFGLSLVEAAASGCPIITTDVGLVGDVLKNNDGALVCPTGDKNCVEKQIEILMEYPELRSRISGSAKDAINVLPNGMDTYLSRLKNAWYSLSGVI